MEHLTRADFERFWRQVNVGLAEHCWEFKGFLNKEGYGKFATRANGKSKNVSAHRVAYRSIRGPLTKGLVIRHLCHNPASLATKIITALHHGFPSVANF